MRSKLARAGVAGASLLGAGVAVAVVTQLNDLQRVDAVDDRAFTHSDQLTIRSSDFDDVFEAGDEFFDTEFNLLDGGGANVGRGQRYSRVPRADLRGPGEWFNHQPARETGPNAAACTDCHRGPGDGAGAAGSNVHRDPRRNGIVGQFIQRNTPHLFGGGALQVLAEEMTQALQDHVKQTIAPYKYPRAIEYVAQLPKTETGKLRRYALRQIAAGGPASPGIAAE